MTSPEGAVPVQLDAYTLPPTSNAYERLISLYGANPNLFWFLQDVADPTEVQFQSFYDSGFARYPFTHGVQVDHPMMMELGCTTMASNPENKLNEDVFVTMDLSREPEQVRQLVAVIDGASSQLPIAALTEYGVSGAFYISHLIKYGFQKSEEYAQLRSREDLSAKDIVEVVNGWVHQQLEGVKGVDYNDAATIPGAAATFALVDFPKAKISLAHVADTIAVSAVNLVDDDLLHSTQDAQVMTDNRNRRFDDETAALVDAIMQEQGIDRPTAVKDPRVREQLRASFRRKINTPDGCGILNGMPELITNGLIQEQEIDLLNDPRMAASGVDTFYLILASDGFYSIVPTDESGAPDAAWVAETGAMFKGSPRRKRSATMVEDVWTEFTQDSGLNNPPRLKIVDDITLASMKIRVDFPWWDF